MFTLTERELQYWPYSYGRDDIEPLMFQKLVKLSRQEK